MYPTFYVLLMSAEARPIALYSVGGENGFDAKVRLATYLGERGEWQPGNRTMHGIQTPERFVPDLSFDSILLIETYWPIEPGQRVDGARLVNGHVERETFIMEDRLGAFG